MHMESNMMRSTCGTEGLHPLRGLTNTFTPIHGFEDSPVALCLHPFRVDHSVRANPRVRGLTGGLMPAPFQG